MSGNPRPSSRHPHPHRMPTRTYWRGPEPSDDDVTAHFWVEHMVRQAERTPEPTPPATTTPDWVKQQMREERVEAADDAVATSRAGRDAHESWVPPVAAPAQVLAWQRERELAERAAVRRLRILTAGLVTVAVALAAVLAAGTWWWIGRPDDTAGQAQTVAGGVRTGETAPLSPVALPADGEHIRVRVLDSGDLGVEQWVRPPAGVGTLELAPPDGVQVSDLTVVADSVPVEAPTSLLTPTQVAFVPGATVYLSYRLSGALERSGSTRALARATSVSFGDDPESRTIDFVGATLLSLACTPTSGTAVPVPCGAEAGAKGWQVVAPGALGDVQVMAQIDLHPTG